MMKTTVFAHCKGFGEGGRTRKMVRMRLTILAALVGLILACGGKGPQDAQDGGQGIQSDHPSELPSRQTPPQDGGLDGPEGLCEDVSDIKKALSDAVKDNEENKKKLAELEAKLLDGGCRR